MHSVLSVMLAQLNLTTTPPEHITLTDKDENRKFQ